MATSHLAKSVGQIINEMPSGVFKTLEKIDPIGALQARKQSNGAVLLYWRYSIGSSSERVAIGTYDSSAPPKSLQPTSKGYSVAAAMTAASALAQEHYDHRAEGGRPALLAKEELEKQLALKAVAEEEAKVATAQVSADKFNLKALLSDYCDYLESLGRRSFSDAHSIFRIHVFEAWPKIASMPASEVTDEHIADMMRKVIEAGKGRTSNKLRSYIRAAYQVAKASKSKPRIPLRFKSYGIRYNPAADTEPDESANKADKNPLSLEDMRAYWQQIKVLPGFIGSVLRLHLLTGGQRLEQLCNLLTANVAADYIILLDGKGRPGKPPRPHVVPLIGLAATAMRECKPSGVYAISTDGGNTHLSATTLSDWACAAAEGIFDFKTKRLRSGVETLLAKAQILENHRGRLQSHGLSGVQQRHYDGHNYMEEKRNALETLFNWLEGNDSNKPKTKTKRVRST